MLYSGTCSNPFRAYPLACLQLELLELGTEEAPQGRSLTSIQRSTFYVCQTPTLESGHPKLVSFLSSLSLKEEVVDEIVTVFPAEYLYSADTPTKPSCHRQMYPQIGKSRFADIFFRHKKHL